MVDEAAQGDVSGFRIGEKRVAVIGRGGDVVDEWLGVIKIGEAKGTTPAACFVSGNIVLGWHSSLFFDQSYSRSVAL